MRKALWIVVPVLLAAPVSAEIWKCAGKNGADVYQNFPCHLDSIGSQSSSPAGMFSPAPLAVSAARPAPTAPVKATVIEPKPGMTQDDVRAIWGDPVEMIEDSPSRGRIEIWQYGGSRSVQFNHKRRVVAVQR